MPQPGGWLHLDVSRGASGTLLAAALLDLGVPLRTVREAFDDAGLSAVGLYAAKVTLPGAHGTKLRLLDAEDRWLLGPEEPPRVRRSDARTPLRRRHQAPHVHVRKADAPKALGIAQGDPGAAPSDDGADEDEERATPTYAAVHVLRGESIPGVKGPEGAVESRGPVHGWLRDELVSAADLLAFVSNSELAPVPKAIAQKALRRALEARSLAFGHERLDEPTLPGRFAVALVAEAVACAALLAALSPARVTASAISLDVAPDPWLDAVLVGMRAREEDVGFSPTTPLGAALVWAVAHRTGPRGDVVLRRAGSGVGRAVLRERPEVSRALYGDDVSLPTRAGSAATVELRRLEALTARGDRAALVRSLEMAGASCISSEPVLDADGNARDRLVCAAPDGAVEQVTKLLLGAAAKEVLVSTVERRAPERREVTVSVGRGKRRELVRLTELRAGGSVLSVEPSASDLEEAASRLGAPVSALSHEALLAYEERALGGTEER